MDWTWAHIAFSVFIALYPVITWPIRYATRDILDCAYLSLIAIIFGHWMIFRNECIVSYFEKKQIDPMYKLGECPYVNPFTYVMASATSRYVKTFIVSVLPIINVIIVVYRLRLMGYVSKVFVVVTLALFWMTGKFFSDTSSKSLPRCKALERASALRALSLRHE
jgi:tetrahydromethanopterin S-methyltransferase subunit D